MRPPARWCRSARESRISRRGTTSCPPSSTCAARAATAPWGARAVHQPGQGAHHPARRHAADARCARRRPQHLLRLRRHGRVRHPVGAKCGQDRALHPARVRRAGRLRSHDGRRGRIQHGARGPGLERRRVRLRRHRLERHPGGGHCRRRTHRGGRHPGVQARDGHAVRRHGHAHRATRRRFGEASQTAHRRRARLRVRMRRERRAGGACLPSHRTRRHGRRGRDRQAPPIRPPCAP